MSLNNQLNLDDVGFNLKLAKYFVGCIKPYVKGKVLDLGCGVGVVSNLIAKAGFKVTGVDGSKKKITYARENKSYITWIHSYFEDYEPQEPFDTIIAKNVLEHLSKIEVEDLLRNIYKWLNPKGRFIAYVPNALSLNRRLGFYMGISPYYGFLTREDEEVGHVQTYTRQKLELEVNKVGFTLLECKGLFLKPFPNAMMMLINDDLCDALFQVAEDPLVADLCSGIYIITEKT